MNKYGKVFESIDPNFKNIMIDLITNDTLNSKSHDEGNYDVDRLDYILRDALYAGERLENYTHEQYKRKYARIDENGEVMKNVDGSIMLVNDENSDVSKTPIDVYGRKSLEPIEIFLERRVQAYKNIYFSDKIQVSDSLVGIFIKYAIEHGQEEYANELKTFINLLKNQDVNVDIKELLKWEDIRFYSNCINIGENSKNPHLRSLAAMVIPNLQALMNVTFWHLDLKNERANNFANLSEYDMAFINKIKELIYSDSDLAKMLKDKEYYKKNCLICNDRKKIDIIKQKFGDKVMHLEATVRGYKKDIPIYVEDINGRVFMLHEHPERNCDWENRKETVNVAFVAIPILKLQGLSDEEINEIIKVFQEQETPDIGAKSNSTNRKINMSPVKTGSRIEEYFCI